MQMTLAGQSALSRSTILHGTRDESNYSFPMTFPLPMPALFQCPRHCIFRQWRALLGQRHYRQFWNCVRPWWQAPPLGNATIDNFGPSTQRIHRSKTNVSTECSATCRCRHAQTAELESPPCRHFGNTENSPVQRSGKITITVTYRLPLRASCRHRAGCRQ